MNIVIETDRLLLRTFTIDDAPLLYELNSDPEVIRYTYDPITSPDHAAGILENTILPQYTLYNYGRWVVHAKARLEFIGCCGLKCRPERKEVDLGYRFKRPARGKGYTTELAYTCLKYGFAKLNIMVITSRAIPGNIRSSRVLEKIGMPDRRAVWKEFL